VIFVENNCNNAAFHFSAEEFFIHRAKYNEPVLLLWQAEKTVMLGNNQSVNAEVNLTCAEEFNISIVRRSSGGGAIYTDSGTVLYSLIEPVSNEITVHREGVAVMLIDALGKMKVPAYRDGKNDILAEGRKFSGLAQYSSGSHVCTHGSILYDTDLDILTKVLIPDETKLQPKGIRSIRSRVGNIKSYIAGDLTVYEFIQSLKNILLPKENYTTYSLDNNDLIEINRISDEKYSSKNWNFRIG